MKKYDIPTLNENTPRADQATIMRAVKNVSGVSSVILHPHDHQLEVGGRAEVEPKREDIAAAMAKAGYPMAGK